MDRPHRSKPHKINQVDRWPVTYHQAAMGTLLAYSALGVTKVAVAAPCAERKGKDRAPLGPQALVVRRFAIAPGNLGDTMDAFARVSGISVKFTDNQLRTLPSNPPRPFFRSTPAAFSVRASPARPRLVEFAFRAVSSSLRFNGTI